MLLQLAKYIRCRSNFHPHPQTTGYSQPAGTNMQVSSSSRASSSGMAAWGSKQQQLISKKLSNEMKRLRGGCWDYLLERGCHQVVESRRRRWRSSPGDDGSQIQAVVTMAFSIGSSVPFVASACSTLQNRVYFGPRLLLGFSCPQPIPYVFSFPFLTRKSRDTGGHMYPIVSGRIAASRRIKTSIRQFCPCFVASVTQFFAMSILNLSSNSY